MKKIVLTVAIVLGMTMGASAQVFGNENPYSGGLFGGGGLFGRGVSPEEGGVDAGLFEQSTLGLPDHGEETNQPASQEEAPLGGGAMLLIGFGAAYAMAKKRKE